MRAKVLIVDDMQIRHDGLPRLVTEEADFSHAYTVAQAVLYVQQAWNPPIRVTKDRQIIEPPSWDFDMIFMDHDCDVQEGPHFIVFARWLVENKDRFQKLPLIYIHSGNVVGALALEALFQTAGFQTLRRMFTP
jgi:hypothetical protein